MKFSLENRHWKFALLFCCLVLTACQEDSQEYAPLSPSTLDLTMIEGGSTTRISSWDQSGANRDFIFVGPGEEKVLAELEGSGCIQHIYFTSIRAGTLLRELVLRIYWDGEEEPSVEVPLGDFFLMGHCVVRHIRTTFVTVNTGTAGSSSHGYNCYFRMPYDDGARITLENQGKWDSGNVWYHIEYESYDKPLPPNVGRFHAQWRREISTTSSVKRENKNRTIWDGINDDGDDNYVILEAEGAGRLVGLLLNVENVQNGWYGEGDDMIFIDGQTWPPAYHGTGSEEIFGGGACPNQEYAGPYSGFHLTENKGGVNFAGKISMFRWYVYDPVRFEKSVRWTIEHGHANNFENDYSSVAYWYQLEPHKTFPELPPAGDRMPLMPEVYFEATEALLGARTQITGMTFEPEARQRLRALRREGNRLFNAGRYEEALGRFEQHAREVEKLKLEK